MKRWNGWGNIEVEYPLHESALSFLESKLGPSRKPQDISLEELTKKVPQSHIGHKLVTTDSFDRVRHARGQSLPDWIALRSGNIEYFPAGVAYPQSNQDIKSLINYAYDNDIALIPYGGGTSVVGHINIYNAKPTITVDLSKMSKLMHLNEENHTATFQAGINGSDLEAMLNENGYTLGHFPQSFEYSTLGGWIATRSSGQQSLGYGRIERMFLGGKFITPHGELNLPPFPASAAGPDLKEIILGSEGRYGILTEATVRIHKLPEREIFKAVFFPTFSHGLKAIRELSRQRTPLTMLRLSTEIETITTLALAGRAQQISILETLLGFRGIGENKVLLLYGIAGTKEEVSSQKSIRNTIKQYNGVHVPVFGSEWHKSRFKTPYLRNTLWELGYAVDTLETAIPWGKALGLIRDLQEKISNGLDKEKVHTFTHVSHMYTDGCSVYTTYIYKLSDSPEENLRKWQILKGLASETIIQWGGTISHQHGVGKDHLPYLSREKGALGLQVLGTLGMLFDPENILNPGKLF